MTSKLQFQQLAEMHAEDAQVLHANGRQTNSMHLAGLAIECALKALVCDHFEKGALPDPKLVQRAHSHELAALVGLAGIKPDLDALVKEDPEFDARWSITKTWSVAVRYDTVSEIELVEFLDATVGQKGMLEWIKTFW